MCILEGELSTLQDGKASLVRIPPLHPPQINPDLTQSNLIRPPLSHQIRARHESDSNGMEFRKALTVFVSTTTLIGMLEAS